MASSTYRLFAQAMRQRKTVVCLYDGFPRAICPIILGHTDGDEKALVFQVAGESDKPLPRGGGWKCFTLAKVNYAQLIEGPWRATSQHRDKQSCVKDVDLDVNPSSPYRPRRKLDR